MEINMAALQKYDPKVTQILRSALQVAIYKFNSGKSSWEKTDAEGTLFICTRSDSPLYAMMLLNKLNRENFLEPITPDMEVAQENQQYLLYRKGDEKLSDQKKSTDYEHCVPERKREGMTQITNKLNQTTTHNPADADIKETGIVKQSTPQIFKPVPIQLDSLMQSSKPVKSNALSGVGATVAPTVASAIAPHHSHHQQTASASESVSLTQSALSSEISDGPATAAAGKDLLQKLLTGGASVSSPTKQAQVQPLKSLPLTRDQPPQELLRSSDIHLTPCVSDPRFCRWNESEIRSQNGTHFLLTPADFETCAGETTQPVFKSCTKDAKNIDPQEMHSIALDKDALKRAFFDLLQVI